MRIALFAVFSVVLGACAPTTAVVNGQRVPRIQLAYTDGYYYAVTHYAAYPEARGPSSGLRSYGGRLAGFACGAAFNYESDFHGRSLLLGGFAQASDPSTAPVRIQIPAHLEVRDVDGHRHITGSIGDDMGTLLIAHDRASRVIDFTLGADGLHGQVGSRLFDVARVDAETMVGTVTISTGEVLPFEMRGISQMWSMPAADQAAILPFMLTCSQVEEGRHVEGQNTETSLPLVVLDFGRRG
jgi:hypothetical protein